MEKLKELIALYSRNKMPNLLLLKFIKFTESTTIHKSTLPMSKESSKCLTGVISASLNSTNWRTSGPLSRENSAELLMAHKKMLMWRALLGELSRHFHTQLMDFTTETRSETSPHQKLSEISTRMKLDWPLFLDLPFWANGNAIGKSDTTCQSRATWKMRLIISI